MARSTSHTTARMHPDATLLRLMSQHVKAQARVEFADTALEADPRSMSENVFDRLCAKVSDIEDAILAQPSRTPAGLGIKAQIAARYMQSPEDWGVRTYDVLGCLVDELLRLTAACRPEAAVIAPARRTAGH